MLRAVFVTVVLASLIGAAVPQKKPFPRFKDYPAPDKFSGKPARPKLTSRRARLFRSNIRWQTAEGPDFAGHYKVVTWGCGAGCVQFAIVNVQTGDVHFPPEVETVMALPEREEDPVQRRTGSRLLVLTGRKVKPGWRAAEDGKFYYEWKDDRLVLLRKVKLQTKY
ncbi:MAG TPA: hypothetical protein PLD20_11475 [Blastocatellia bacterium]|nr:hypothetical protein [Blastocatellia bacterium]HMV86251.1 hypothetical protein [Blastocatellia bacterium]HMX27855.1 hypothetical protein [Blastocatellia bacterium]HMY71588.1 hypothetical protein [Blastocatellia bacterium]HMZ18543.1 hypothetical protein [Blastocatellia bacterium]